MDQSIVNSHVDHYLITERIKAGGVAVVYRAVDQRDQASVAFKLLQANWAEHDEIVRRFQIEAQIMNRLDHPHIVNFRETGMLGRRPYITMDFMEGGSLSERLKANAQITLGATSKLLAQIASALDYAHRKGIIHRDMKPGNILMRDNQHASLTDFGIARLLDHTSFTLTGQMPGTPHYMSPEQARGLEDITAATDQYSLAVIAYLLSVGRLPFSGGEALVIINQHMTMDPPRPTARRPDLPAGLDDILLRALEKDPADRFATSGAFARAFGDAIAGYEDLNVTLRVGQAQPNMDYSESFVFSSTADTPPLLDEMTDNPIRIKSASGEGRSGGRNRVLIGMTIAGIVIALLLLGVILLNNADENGGLAQFDQQTATALALAALASDTATITPTETPSITPSSTPSSTPTLTPTATATASVTPSPTPSATETPRPTETPQPTATVTPSLTPTATATATASNTPTPSVTPTATPLFASLDGVLTGLLDETGNAGRFDCVRFNQAYEFLQDQLDTGGTAYEPARLLLDPSDAPARTIYEEFCLIQPDDREVFITPPSLVLDMRNAINDIIR
jgi:eukaryotic-like serine/threonine-protein kinase